MPASVELEEAVYMWYEQEQSKGVTLRGAEVQSAADRLAKDLKIENYSASSGWLWRLRNRHGLRYRKLCGEDLARIREVLNTSGRSVASFLTSADYICIRSTARARLTCSTGPSTRIQTYRSITQMPLEKKSSKERFSAVLCANAEGSHRLKVVVVGKVRQPRTLKWLIDKLPVRYYCLSSASCTDDIGDNWFMKYVVTDSSASTGGS
jgi:hypothetical protein